MSSTTSQSKLSFRRVGIACSSARWWVHCVEVHLQKYLLIAVGGALGSLARYAVGTAVAGRMGPRFFYGTFVVNMTACLIIGFSVTWLGRHAGVNPAWRYLIPIGFIGAYSTFSTFELEAFTALQTDAFLLATLYVTLSVLLGLIAVWLGVLLARIAF
jgi:fluoride exporter